MMQDGVDYGVIRRVQLVGVSVFMLLLAMQFVFRVEGVEGWWIVPAPFLPVLLWNYSNRSDKGSRQKEKLKAS